MTPRWYHSRLFWLGLPGIALIMWLWLGHLGSMTLLSWSARGTDAFSMAWGGGVLGICASTEKVYPRCWNGEDIHARGAYEMVFRHTAGYKHSSWRLSGESPRYVFQAEHRHGRKAPVIMMDLRLVAACYIMFWLGGTAWWGSRKHRLMANPLHPAVILP